MAVRLSYKLIRSVPGWGQTKGEWLRVQISYEFGRMFSPRARFRSADEAGRFIGRFYPDLIGKCSGVEELRL